MQNFFEHPQHRVCCKQYYKDLPQGREQGFRVQGLIEQSHKLEERAGFGAVMLGPSCRKLETPTPKP